MRRFRLQLVLELLLGREVSRLTAVALKSVLLVVCPRRRLVATCHLRVVQLQGWRRAAMCRLRVAAVLLCAWDLPTAD